MIKKHFDKPGHEEADFRLPLSMAGINGIVLLISVITAISICLVWQADTALPLRIRTSLIVISIALFSLAAFSTAVFLFHVSKKHLSAPLTASCGGSLFFFLQGFLFIHILEMGPLSSLQELNLLLSRYALGYLQVTMVPALAGSAFLIISELVKICRSGSAKESLPGLSFCLLSLGGRLLFMAAGQAGHPALLKKIFCHSATGIGFCIAYMELLFLACLICGLIALWLKPGRPADYIIIPGCKVWPDGTMSLSLKNRVDRALLYEKDQYRTRGKHAVFLPSGGKGNDRTPSEADAMKKYLLNRGIAEEYILVENRSVTTYQNFLYSKRLLETQRPLPNQKKSPSTEDAGTEKAPYIIFCSADYHLLRCAILADQTGLSIRGIPCRSHWYIYAGACLREYLALAYLDKVQHLILLAGILTGFCLPSCF